MASRADKLDPSDLKTPGQRVLWARTWRFPKKLSQKEVIRRMHGVIKNQSSLSDIESGETKEISGPTLIALATALDVRPDWIITGELPIERDLQDDEKKLIAAYQISPTSWRKTLLALAALDAKQREALMSDVLTHTFSGAVSDAKVEETISAAPDPGD